MEYTSLESIHSRFIYWLNEHVKTYLEEQTTPDLWAMSQEEHDIFGPSEFNLGDATNFAPHEQEALRIAIAAFRLRIIESFQPIEEQLIQVDQRLKYLTDSVDRLNKIDWKSLLLSTIIGIATSLSLDTERGRLLFEIAKQVFSNALHLLK